MSEGSPASEPEQGGPTPPADRLTLADLFTAIRIPLAVLFVLLPRVEWRLGILFVAGATDLLDGFLARRFGSSRLGVFLDPVADKLFMAAAFGVVAFSRRLELFEVAGVLARDAAATVAFVVTMFTGRAASIPARLGGKAVTVAQMLTLLAFLVDSSLLRPMAWATSAVALYAIWDYSHAAAHARRPLGS